MNIYQNYSLKKLNAFHVDVKTKYFAEVKTYKDLKDVLSNPKFIPSRTMILGEASGTLFTRDYGGLVIKVSVKGKKIIRESKDNILIEVGAGEIWDDFVKWAVNNNYSGVENLSAIPGTVGAAPVQNIAAYGQCFEDVFINLVALNIKTGREKTFNKKQCELGYRDSIFKNKLKNKYIIIKVFIKLGKNTQPDTSYHSRYESLEEILSIHAKKPYSLKDTRKAVKKIRKKKFPNWKVYGNSGSFFKNPVISTNKLNIILKKYPNLQYYPIDKLSYPKADDPTFNHSKHVKIAAGWLLEELGWRGKRIGNVGTSPNQSLVVVNYGKATARDILNFTNKMKSDFKNHFGIELIPEVNII